MPDELHARAKRFADAREMSLAELVRRGIERFLDQFPPPEQVATRWKLPSADLGGIKVPLERLKERAADDEGGRSLARRRR